MASARPVELEGDAKLLEAVFKVFKRAVTDAQHQFDGRGDLDFGRDFWRRASGRFVLILAPLPGSQTHLLVIGTLKTGRDGEAEFLFQRLGGGDMIQPFPFAAPDFTIIGNPGSENVGVFFGMLDERPRTIWGKFHEDKIPHSNLSPEFVGNVLACRKAQRDMENGLFAIGAESADLSKFTSHCPGGAPQEISANNSRLLSFAKEVIEATPKGSPPDNFAFHLSPFWPSSAARRLRIPSLS